MNSYLDIGLTIVAVLFAAIYLIRRKIKSQRRLNRDWVSGHADSCGSCPVLKIRAAAKK